MEEAGCSAATSMGGIGSPLCPEAAAAPAGGFAARFARPSGRPGPPRSTSSSRTLLAAKATRSCPVERPPQQLAAPARNPKWITETTGSGSLPDRRRRRRGSRSATIRRSNPQGGTMSSRFRLFALGLEPALFRRRSPSPRGLPRSSRRAARCHPPSWSGSGSRARRPRRWRTSFGGAVAPHHGQDFAASAAGAAPDGDVLAGLRRRGD